MSIDDFVTILTQSTLAGFGLAAFFSFLGYIVRGVFTVILDYRP
jgi:hypothetical protein